MYATIEQANAYIAEYYSSTSPQYISWNSLGNGDKQVLLNRAEQTIDQLPLRGTPVVAGKAFPREPDLTLSLSQAQLATIELAAQRQGNLEAQARFELQNQGVKSYKIGDLSETFMDASGYEGLDAFAYSIVFPFLKDWLGGGFKICPTHTGK